MPNVDLHTCIQQQRAFVRQPYLRNTRKHLCGRSTRLESDHRGDHGRGLPPAIPVRLTPGRHYRTSNVDRFLPRAHGSFDIRPLIIRHRTERIRLFLLLTELIVNLKHIRITESEILSHASTSRRRQMRRAPKQSPADQTQPANELPPTEHSRHESNRRHIPHTLTPK